MSILTICPCCSTRMLHHFGNHREYWFCRHCWAEMPDLEGKVKIERNFQPSLKPIKTISLSTGFKTLISQH